MARISAVTSSSSRGSSLSNFSTTVTLAPGNYRDLTVGNSFVANLSSGTYVFRNASSANSTRGEKISDCGSAICGMPPNTLGDQKGDWP